MLVKHFNEAKPYEAPNHYGMVALRLQGFEEGGPKNFWTGLSHISSMARTAPSNVRWPVQSIRPSPKVNTSLCRAPPAWARRSRI